MHSRRVGSAICIGLLTAVVGVAGVAWACTPNSNVAAGPDSGPPGTTVTVRGELFQDAPVTIHWNSADEAPLATAQGPSFSIRIEVPPGAAAGAHYIVGVHRDGAGRITRQTAAPFVVEGAEGTPPSASGRDGSASGSASGTTSGGTRGSGWSAGSDPATVSEESPPPQDDAGSTVSGPGRRVARPPTAESSPAGTALTPATHPAVPAPATEGAVAHEADPQPLPPLDPAPPVLAANATVNGDPWGGFRGSAKAVSLGTPPPDVDERGSMATGAALMTLGVAVLGCVGLVFSGRLRRRSPAVAAPPAGK